MGDEADRLIEQYYTEEEEYYNIMAEREVIEGVIERMHTKSGSGQRGAWTKYSAVINGGWVNFGFEDPGYSEGQTVKVAVEDDQYGKQVKQHRLADVQQATGTNASDKGGDKAPSGSYANGQAWGNCSNVAASLIVTLKDLDALPITVATGKANKAKRFDEVMDIYDKLRVKLYRDSEDISRVLDNVADFGEVATNDPAPLPNGEVEQEEVSTAVEELEDDIPF